MTIADPKVGGWALHERLTHGEVNAIRAGLLKAVDGVDGGAYTLASPLSFDGAAVTFEADLNVGASGELTVDGNLVSNSLFAFNGQGEFNDDVNVNDRWVFRSGGQTEFKAGNTVLFFSLDDLTIGTPFVLQAMRVPLVPLMHIRDISGLTQGWHFEPTSIGAWLNDSLGESLYFMLPIMAGDVLNSVTATVRGDFSGGAAHGVTDPAAKMRLRVLEAPATNGPYTAIATQVDAATGAAYDALHLLTASTGGYTALDRHYVIEMRAESGANAFVANGLYQLQATLLRKRLVSGNSFGS